MSLAEHKRLGHFEILGVLGAGGMGEVYKARDTRLERTVAIKVLPAEMSKRQDFRERFEREARAISALSHPHICALHDIGNDSGVFYLVMEHLEGKTLSERLTKGPLPAEEAVQYTIQILEALDEAHRHGIIHRDLKPANVMLTRLGVKLLDFGLAKMKALSLGAGAADVPTRSLALTTEGVLLGTIPYMAPEQLEGKDADARSDIFAFGALMYEMLTGARAFKGESQASVIAAIIGGEPAPLLALQPSASPVLDQVVRTCLKKDPAERWQSAHDIAQVLRLPTAGGGPVAVKPGTWSRRDLLIGASAGAALAGAAGVVIVRGRRQPQGQLAHFSFPIQQPYYFFVAVSPDGRHIAYTSGGATGSEIRIRPVGSN